MKPKPSKTLKKPHKWRELIIKWANGETIQCRLISYDGNPTEWWVQKMPQWYDTVIWEYRAKPYYCRK